MTKLVVLLGLLGLVACTNNEPATVDAPSPDRCIVPVERTFSCSWRQACGGEYDTTVRLTVDAADRAAAEALLVKLCDATTCVAAHDCHAACDP